jgi:hypothetical protein
VVVVVVAVTVVVVGATVVVVDEFVHFPTHWLYPVPHPAEPLDETQASVVVQAPSPPQPMVVQGPPTQTGVAGPQWVYMQGLLTAFLSPGAPTQTPVKTMLAGVGGQASFVSHCASHLMPPFAHVGARVVVVVVCADAAEAKASRAQMVSPRSSFFIESS